MDFYGSKSKDFTGGRCAGIKAVKKMLIDQLFLMTFSKMTRFLNGYLVASKFGVT